MLSTQSPTPAPSDREVELPLTASCDGNGGCPIRHLHRGWITIHKVLRDEPVTPFLGIGDTFVVGMKDEDTVVAVHPQRSRLARISSQSEREQLRALVQDGQHLAYLTVVLANTAFTPQGRFATAARARLDVQCLWEIAMVESLLPYASVEGGQGTETEYLHGLRKNVALWEVGHIVRLWYR
ncbi:hypothetical protein BJ508DRAFT_329675 [Ascobolus immersus RN42]|uniref:Uncharacterized protein n=1 Tax=Ascobolus immersus RN42 TaxID=1160509 RepID=A0A3N4HWI7_ASCIM|nr:hypothetical protein BJ508DRAFT_329675 [Ascobolus immersus RN42]